MSVREEEEEEEETGGSGEQMTEDLLSFLGSWSFLLLQTLLLLVSIGGTLVMGSRHWDFSPFVAVNLFFSVQVIFLIPLILMSQNRQRKKDQAQVQQQERQQRFHSHQLGKVTTLLHHLSEIQQQQESTLKDLAREVTSLKWDREERLQERHRLDQIFAVQSTTNRIERVTKEIHELTLLADVRRVRRGKRRETLQRRKQLEQWADEVALLARALQQEQQAGTGESVMTDDLTPALPPPLDDREQEAITQPVKRVTSLTSSPS